MSNKDYPSITSSILFGFFIMLSLWIVIWIDLRLNFDLKNFGILPRNLSGIKGVFFAPFLHLNLSHLINNSIPIFVLCSLLHYFYNSIFFRVLLFSTLLTGLGVWVFARPVYHIGASGIIYSLVGFIFLSGIIKKYPKLIAIS